MTGVEVLVWAWSLQEHTADAAILNLQNLHWDARNLKADVRLWDVLQGLQNKTVEGLGAIDWKAEIQLSIQLLMISNLKLL